MDVASLQVIIKTKGVEAAQRELDKLTKSANNTEKQTNSLSSSFRRLRTTIAGLALFEITRQYAQITDSMKLLEARIKLVSSASDDYANVQKNLTIIANQNRVSIESVGQLYTKLKDPLTKLGVSTSSVLNITDAFSKSLLISGASTQEAAAATQQFAQAMASGRLQGDEFRSIAENSPRFLRLMSEELGVSAGALRKMAEEGKLTADVVGGALLQGVQKLREEAKTIPTTIGGSFTVLLNEIKLTSEEIDKQTGLNNSMAEAINNVTKNIVLFREELPKLSRDMQTWRAENEKGIYTLELMGSALIDTATKYGKLSALVMKSTFNKNLETGLTLIGAIGDGIGIAGDDQLRANEALTKQAEKLKEAEKSQKALTESKKTWAEIVQGERDLDSMKMAVKIENDKIKLAKEKDEAEKKALKEAQKLNEEWANRKIEIATNMAIAEQDELAKPFILLSAKYDEDMEHFKGIKEAQLKITEEFNAEYQRLAKDTSSKVDEDIAKSKQKDIQKELKLQEENFRIQARQVELLDDEADKQVALATLEYQRTQASLKAQVLLGEKTPEYYDAMMEMEDKLLEKQKQNWTLAGQVVNNVTSQMESSMTDFLDVTSDNFADFGKMATSILQDVYREIIRISVVKPLVSSLTSGAMSLFGGSSLTSLPDASTSTAFTGSEPLLFAKGGSFSSPSLSQYSNQVVDKPTFFAFAQGGAPNAGVMGEAGSEAILPLTRTSSGNLGVEASGIGAQTMKIQIINESGTQMEVTKTTQTTDMEGIVIQAWISGISKNRYGSRDMLSGGR